MMPSFKFQDEMLWPSPKICFVYFKKMIIIDLVPITADKEASWKK